jgi:transglutaminase-like putative cysteine protease
MMRKPAIIALLLAASCASSFPVPSDRGEAETVEVRCVYRLGFYGNASSARLIAKLPPSVAGRQVVGDFRYSPEPLRVYASNGERFALFLVNREEGKDECRVEILMKVRFLACAQSGPAGVEARYYDGDRYTECYEEPIQKLARELRKPNIIATAVKVQECLNARIGYTAMDERIGAKKALGVGRGDCTEYADAFIALMRAARYPARHVSGLALGWEKTSLHDAAELYLPEFGWIHVEPIGSRETLFPEYNDFVILTMEDSAGGLYEPVFWKVQYDDGFVTVAMDADCRQ